MQWMLDPSAWMALLTLTALEIVLGIDNIIFITVLVGRLPEAQRNSARKIGLAAAMLTRLMLLASLVWLASLIQPLFTLFNIDFSIRDLILFVGGLFLLYKATAEIHESLEGEDESEGHKKINGFYTAIAQIAIIDIVFSLDSVITAIGLAEQLAVMALAIVLAVVVMLFAAKGIGDFVDQHPSLKMLALSFLLLVGVTLMAEGLHFHVPKGYIYFAMAFSVGVEFLNIHMRKKKSKPLALHKKISE